MGAAEQQLGVTRAGQAMSQVVGQPAGGAAGQRETRCARQALSVLVVRQPARAAGQQYYYYRQEQGVYSPLVQEDVVGEPIVEANC